MFISRNCYYYYYFTSAAVAVDFSHMTVSSSASWIRISPLSNVVNGHVSTVWFMVCRWPQLQEGDWVRPHLCICPETVHQRPCRGRSKPGRRILGSVLLLSYSDPTIIDYRSNICQLIASVTKQQLAHLYSYLWSVQMLLHWKCWYSETVYVTEQFLSWPFMFLCLHHPTHGPQEALCLWWSVCLSVCVCIHAGSPSTSSLSWFTCRTVVFFTDCFL